MTPIHTEVNCGNYVQGGDVFCLIPCCFFAFFNSILTYFFFLIAAEHCADVFSGVSPSCSGNAQLADCHYVRKAKTAFSHVAHFDSIAKCNLPCAYLDTQSCVVFLQFFVASSYL